MQEKNSLKRKPPTLRRPLRKAKRPDGKAIVKMVQDGLVEDEIASRLGVHKNTLRARYIADIKQGKAARVAAKEALSAVTPEEYHFLIAAAASFSSDWYDPAYGNDLFQGMDINEAFAFWKQQCGKYICIGLSSRIDPRKAAEFSKIVANYQQSALAVTGETSGSGVK